MKNAKRSLVISILTLVVAVAIATTSTFAWFAMTETPTVDQFNLTVTSQNGLLIANDANKNVATEYKMSMNVGTIATTTKLDAVTPDGTFADNAFTMNPTTFSLKKIDGATAADAGSYYSFTAHFLSTVAYDIYLGSGEVATDTQSARTVKSPIAVDAAAVADYPEAVAIGDDIDAQAKDAARIAAVGTAGYVVYNPNPTTGWSAYATTNMAHEIYDNLAGTAALTDAQKTESTAVKTTLDTTTLSNNVKLTTLTLVASAEDANYGNLFNYYGEGTAVYAGSVTVYVWVEGKDADCFASIYEDIMDIDIAFFGSYTV